MDFSTDNTVYFTFHSREHKALTLRQWTAECVTSCDSSFRNELSRRYPSSSMWYPRHQEHRGGNNCRRNEFTETLRERRSLARTCACVLDVWCEGLLDGWTGRVRRPRPRLHRPRRPRPPGRPDNGRSARQTAIDERRIESSLSSFPIVFRHLFLPPAGANSINDPTCLPRFARRPTSMASNR